MHGTNMKKHEDGRWTSVVCDVAVATVHFKNVLNARRFSLLPSKAKVLRENRIIFQNYVRVLLG